jgi:ABC-2 type transport system ATP-binding protein
MITFSNVSRLARKNSTRWRWRPPSVPKAIVENLTFSIAQGERVGLVGANGAGKSTTAKLLTGLMTPSSGNITVAGLNPATRAPEFLSNLGLVSANKNGLLDNLSVWESVLTTARFYGLTNREIRTRFDELSELLELPGGMSQPVRLLSLGERARAELVLALLHKPRLLVLDEPTLGLDFQGSKLLRQHLNLIGDRDGVTVLLTSHNTKDLLDVTERLIVLVKGQIIFDGTYHECMTFNHEHAYLRELAAELIETNIGGTYAA